MQASTRISQTYYVDPLAALELQVVQALWMIMTSTAEDVAVQLSNSVLQVLCNQSVGLRVWDVHVYCRRVWLCQRYMRDTSLDGRRL